MIKTNSKQAKENIKNYIIKNFDISDHTSEAITDYKEICTFIYNTFLAEKYNDSKNYYTRNGYALQDVFKDWAQGLPSVLDTCYFYNRSAKKDLQRILNETDKEAEKYTEAKAEKILTYLIFREITKNKTPQNGQAKTHNAFKGL